MSSDEARRAVCERFGAPFTPPLPRTRVGFAIATQGRRPTHGCRFAPKGDTNGWFIWCGDELSEAVDFFDSLHTEHLVGRCPQALPFLALPPGYRFLVEGDYVDVWLDEALLADGS